MKLIESQPQNSYFYKKTHEYNYKKRYIVLKKGSLTNPVEYFRRTVYGTRRTAFRPKSSR
jgi:hypothetical protein